MFALTKVSTATSRTDIAGCVGKSRTPLSKAAIPKGRALEQEQPTASLDFQSTTG